MSQLKVNRYTRSPQPDGATKMCRGEIIGPNPYTNNGDELNAMTLLFNRYIEHICIGLSNSGTYLARALKAKEGPQEEWKVRIYVVATGAQAGAIDLSAERFPFEAKGL